MVKINVLKFFHFGGLNFPHLSVYCNFSCRASMTSLGIPQMLADLQVDPFYPLPSAELWKAVGWHQGSLQPASASGASNSLLQNTKLQSCSKHLQQETEKSLQLGFAALPKTYKLLDFLIAISRLLSEVVGAARHLCCYLINVIPLCTQVGIYATTLLVWIFFWF